MVAIIFFILTLPIILMFFFLITKEFERISFSITGEDQTKYSFPLSLFLGVLLFFWRTSFENYLLLSLFLMYFVIIYLRYFNRKNAVIPAISFLLVDSLLVFSNGVLNFEDPLLYLVLLQPFFFLSIFNLTKGINEKNSVLYYISNAFFLAFYVIVMFYAYNPDDLNLFLSNVFKLIIAFTLYIFFQFLMIFLINRFYNYVFEKDYVYQQNEFGYYKPYIKNTIIKDFLENNHLSFGAIVSIETRDLNKRNLRIFHRNFISVVEQFFGEVVFFQNNLKNNSFLIKIDDNLLDNGKLKQTFFNNFNANRSQEDILFRLEQIANLFHFYDLKLFVSLYGYDSIDIEELSRQNIFLSNHSLGEGFKNKVLVYDHKYFNKYLKEKEILIDFLEKNDFSLLIHQKRVLNKTFFYDKVIFQNPNTQIDIHNEKDQIFYRFKAFKVIKEELAFGDEEYLILELPAKYLIENYESILEKIKSFIDVRNLVFSIDLRSINLNNKQVFTNLFKLKSAINIHVINFNHIFVKQIVDLYPQYLSFIAYEKVKSSKVRITVNKEKIVKQKNII